MKPNQILDRTRDIERPGIVITANEFNEMLKESGKSCREPKNLLQNPQIEC